ncbi:MAG: hypothetical protein ACJ72N_09465 [Labedaea sp.]
MTRSEGPAGVLAGLVSPQAAQAYDDLLEAVRMPIGTEPGAFDLDGPVGRELFESGVLSVSGDGLVVRPVPPAVALRLVLNRHHRRVLELQQGLFQGWGRFARTVFANPGLGSPIMEDIQGVRVMREPTEIGMVAAGLYRSSTRLLRGTITGGSTRSIDEATLQPPAEAIASGVEFRMIYDTAYAATSWGQDSIDRSVQAGEQARIRHTVPVRMMHVDDALALLSMEPDGALLIRATPLLTLLADWFDQQWADPASTVLGQPASQELTQVRRKVLYLLVSGLSDEVIAHRTGTSVRTIRRHVKEILTVLGVDTRFAAGAAAAKRGWI